MLLLSFLFIFSLTKADPNVIQTTYGPIRGYTQGSVQYFKGVPFAAPPVGENRFKPPQPLKSWTNVKDTMTEGNICPQVHSLGPITIGDEDCLYLDVYRPSNLNLKNLPIMIFIYGGGWVFGDKYELGFYDATNFVNAKPHIHVAMNYRVGALGFMSLPELFKESNTTGNYGLQDQRAAMQWVRDNAKALGGDPSQVTIFGESAGGFSVCWHLVSKASKGLFSRAIIESGNCDSEVFFAPRSRTDKFATHYAQSLGCGPGTNKLKCLRSLTASAVFGGDLYGPDAKLAPVMPWAAAIDGVDIGLLGRPTQLMKQNHYNHVPTIIGTNQNEGDIFVPALPVITGILLPLDRATTHQAAAYFWNNTVADKVVAVYDHSQSWEAALSQAITDWFFACPARRTANAMVQTMNKAWVYHWTFIPDNWIDYQWLGDYHTSEIEYVYHNPWPPIVHTFDARDNKMAKFVQNYWLSMAFGASPNYQNGALHWREWSVRNQTNIRLDLPLIHEQDYRADICHTLWDKVSIYP